MSVDVGQLRRDLRLTAEQEGWPDADLREVGAAIKAAIDAGDEETLQGWAGQLGWWRTSIAEVGQRLRVAEQRIRTEQRAKR
jgi:hypothetical protein